MGYRVFPDVNRKGMPKSSEVYPHFAGALQTATNLFYHNNFFMIASSTVRLLQMILLVFGAWIKICIHLYVSNYFNITYLHVKASLLRRKNTYQFQKSMIQKSRQQYNYIIKKLLSKINVFNMNIMYKDLHNCQNFIKKNRSSLQCLIKNDVTHYK